MMQTDRQGLSLNNANAEAAKHFADAIDDFNRYAGDPVSKVDAAIEAAPDFAMAHLFKAHMYATATEPGATKEAASILKHVSTLSLDEREASHAAAAAHVVAGDWTKAALQLDRHSMDWPHDALALQTGHLIDFFRANARDLRDRISRTLPQWPEDMHGRSFLLGMHAFGLEESGDYEAAEASGREAIAQNPADAWAHHAVAHVMEMQGRAEDGIGWMIAREPHWADDGNFFQVHNWWHRALFHLDLEQNAEALKLYDDHVRGEPSTIAVDLVDAAALLWRFDLQRIDTGSRWTEVADAWKEHADGALYPFNDLHAAMAYLGADRMNDVDDLLADYRSNATDVSEVGRWWHTYGLPLIEGFVAFKKGDYAAAVELLHPARYIVNAYGGSHAQRDVIDWTLMEAALRGNMQGTAEALAHERLTQKPLSPVNRSFIARAQLIG
ncbi:tetratricopeptide repeat protein [Pyruvatibacter sp.]|uniref:tetratricopeptide repeat protein n=2 Tax=Pyruvatibacter sp. TaxID=1981328 RepID=UPI003264A05B